MTSRGPRALFIALLFVLVRTTTVVMHVGPALGQEAARGEAPQTSGHDAASASFRFSAGDSRRSGARRTSVTRPLAGL